MTEKLQSAYRVKFVYDEDARFEECNGESRPLTKAEYAKNQYRACPQHPRSHVVPHRVEQGRAWCGECGTEYADVPYSEYLTYYGNPERHVYLGCVVEKQCPCCKGWEHAESLWHIDMMDDSPELQPIRIGQWMTAADAVKLPGYLGEVARDLLAESR